MKTWINAQGQYLEDVNKTYRDIVNKRKTKMNKEKVFTIFEVAEQFDKLVRGFLYDKIKYKKITIEGSDLKFEIKIITDKKTKNLINYTEQLLKSKITHKIQYNYKKLYIYVSFLDKIIDIEDFKKDFVSIEKDLLKFFIKTNLK